MVRMDGHAPAKNVCSSVTEEDCRQEPDLVESDYKEGCLLN